MLALLLAVVACGGPPFDPSGACTADGRAAGAYPALEALVPAEFDGRRPDSLDSGRNCSRETLGTLADRGVEEMRFAGGIWDLGSGGGVTLAVLEAPGLRPDWVAEFYETGARSGRRVEDVTVSETTIGGRPATRIDALNGESFQTVVVVPDAADLVRVVIVASAIREVQTRAAHDAIVGAALATVLDAA
jgi:hypothetical protein